MPGWLVFSVRFLAALVPTEHEHVGGPTISACATTSMLICLAACKARCRLLGSTQGRTRCLVCGLSVSVRHGVHPTCHPALRAATAPPAANQPGPQLPSFRDIQQGSTPTLRHVPHNARHLWSQTLTRALATVVHRNDEQAWQELLMLPRCVLGTPPRSGRKHVKASAAYTLDRLHRWQQGERMSLWESRGRLLGGAGRSKPPTVDEQRALATALAREGFDRKACNALLSEGLCPQTAATTQALQALHPAQPVPTTPELAAQPLAPVLVPDAVARALRSFPADTAAGPSGLRVQHLREACASGSSEALLQQLCGVVGLLAQGQACAAVAPSLAGASLVALPKPNGGVRPIAVGEILRRLTAKCLMEAVRDEARQHFAPVQLGVATAGGAEAAVHTARAWHERNAGHTGKILVKLDFKNAFNLVSRQAVLDSAALRFPALTRWVIWCYKQPSELHFGQTHLLSAGGVQQGDPLGPLLFASALHPLALELSQGPLDLAFFYLDDGVIAGDVAAVCAALAHIQTRSAHFGLHLNLDKSEVVCLHNGSCSGLAEARAPGLPRRLTISGFWLEQPRPGKAKTLQHATPNSFKSFASPCGDTEHGQSFVAELNWPILLMVMLPALLLLYSYLWILPTSSFAFFVAFSIAIPSASIHRPPAPTSQLTQWFGYIGHGTSSEKGVAEVFTVFVFVRPQSQGHVCYHVFQ